MDTNNEILDAIEILADKKIGENITKILTGICKSVNINNNTCVMDSNGVISTVQFYGSPPEVNELYRIFVPSNNMSRSFIVVPPKFTVNPNLLDNWYFGRSVDQRNGYIIPRDTQIYADSTLTDTSPGVTTAWRQVEYVNSTFCIYRGTDGTGLYYVKTADAVRGYMENTGVMYTIDRWKTENNIVVTLESDGLSIENIGVIAGQFNQELPPNFVPEGSLVCISAMVKSVSGDARLLFSQNFSPYGHTVDFIPLQTGLFSGSGNLMDGNHKFVIYLGAGSKIKLIAAKLELGPTQTLAHLENGNWVLNEIPDYGEQLRKCQRYYYQVHYTQYQTINMAYEDTAYAFLMLPLPVEMRLKYPVMTQSAPILLGTSEKTLVSAEVSGCMARLGLNYDAMTNPSRSCYSYCPNVSGVTFTFSADL